MQQAWGRVKLTEVNPHLVCVLCHGYFIDATTMAECPHSFCRSCIVLYLETKSYCPICEVQIHKTKPHLNLKPDKTLQDMVYKLVPGLFHDEMNRRREFYAKYPNRDLYLSPEARGVGVERIIYSPDDNISLSLEYYDDDREREEWASTRPGTAAKVASPNQQNSSTTTDGLKRYLQCPAVVTMSHLKKFIRLKYGLTQACTVEILYRRESLPDSYSLMDIAYIYTWKRNNPMRFYYRIHVPTPLKKTLPPLKASSEPIRDSTPAVQKLRSPELLDAVGLRPKPPEPTPVTPLVLPTEEKKPKEETKPEEPTKKEEDKKTTPADDAAVSLLLALSNGHGHKSPEQSTPESKLQSGSLERQETTAASSASVRPPTGNGGVFKVPQTMTKRFMFNDGKLVAVKSKPGGKAKGGDKTKINGKMNGESSTVTDRFCNPLGLIGNGPLGTQGGRLPPGSPRPPPNSEKVLKTKYMSPSGLLMNRLTPEVTLSHNKPPQEQSPKKLSQTSPSQQKQISTQVANGLGKPSGMTATGQPSHRKEVNRLEQIVQNCIKKETSQKVAGGTKPEKELELRGDATGAKRSSVLSAGSSEDARAPTSIRPADHVAVPNPSKTDQVDTAEHKEGSILKRKLNDPPFNRRPAPFNQDSQNGLVDPKKRRLVTPDVSIELMAHPAKDQQQKKREPSDWSTLTKRFLNDIQHEGMKKLEELKINNIEQMCASTVKIEKVPAPPSQMVATPKSSPNAAPKAKSTEGNDFNSEDDQLFIDIRNKCEALKRKNREPVNVAIERVSEDQAAKSNQSPASPTKGSEPPINPSSDTSPKPSGTHKKLPRLIEINAPPRPKLPALIPDPKQKIGLKMTTVRKEVPIGKEGPLVRRDCNGALDLSSGMSPPSGASKNGNKSPFHRPASAEKVSTPSSLSPLMAMTSFPMPEANRSPPIRIPTIKPKTSPTPRPSSLSSSSPSPPAEPRTNAEVFPTAAYQQLYRHQMELQNRYLANQVNNNNWSRDPLSAKKFEEWMKNVMNLTQHHLLFPSQLSPEAKRK